MYTLIRVRMTTGKHAGLEVTIADMPGVVERLGGDKVRCLLPGLEGDGVILPQNPANN